MFLEEKLHLSYDFTHLVKNVRNLLFDRDFIIGGKKILVALITLLYNYQKNKKLKLVRYLTRKHVAPTNLERMKVKWAVDIFRPELVAALQLLCEYGIAGFEDAMPLVEFLKIFWRFWEIHDISNTTQYFRQRSPDKMPFYSKDDARLQFLEEFILNWMSDWKNSAINKNQFLSEETYDALVFTCKSTASCIRHLLDEGFNYVLTRKFSTDDIERAHGAIRQQCGSNDHPHVAAALSAVDKIIRTGLAKTSIACNVPLSKEKNATELPLIASHQKKQPVKRRAKLELANCPPEFIKILNAFQKLPGKGKKCFKWAKDNTLFLLNRISPKEHGERSCGT